jgi:hypothetical protein
MRLVNILNDWELHYPTSHGGIVSECRDTDFQCDCDVLQAAADLADRSERNAKLSEENPITTMAMPSCH